MSKQMVYAKRFSGVAVVALMLLSGCDLFKCKSKKCGSVCSPSSSNVKDDSEVLLSIGGKQAVTKNQFDAYYTQFLAANPRLQGMIQFLPNAKQEIFKAMANEEIVLHWAEQNSVCETPEYQAEFEQAVKMVKRGLAAKNFEQNVVGKVSTTEAETKEYYEKHKNPEFIVSPGGVKVVAVEFDAKDKVRAYALFDKTKANASTFKTVAETDKYKVKDFAPINDFSFDIDKNVKEKVSALKTFPSVLVVEGADKKFWVVQAISKEDAKYRSLEEVRDGIKFAIEREKMAKLWNEKIDDLRKKYDIVENVAYFESEKPMVSQGQMPLSQEDLEKIVQDQAEASKGA